MKIISYNVNGLRAAVRKDLPDWLNATKADVFCVQETKARPEQIDFRAFEDLGYRLYFESAEKKGYSGVSIMSKKEPMHVEYGMGISKYDDEGRVIRCDFENFSVMSVYMPSGAASPERQAFKLQWLIDFRSYISELKKDIPNLVICGDFNLCHQAIDIHNPIGLDGYPGFTETERQWMTDFLADGHTDTFRQLNPDPHQYSWWSYRAGARSKNLGWRIDYIVCSDSLNSKLVKSRMLDQAMHSDHCPVVAEFDL